MSADEIRALSDEELMSFFTSTQAHEFLDELMRRHYRPVLAGATAMLRDPFDAEDVAQDTFVRVFTSGHQFSGGNFRGWLFTIARNAALDSISRRRPMEPIQDVSAGSAIGLRSSTLEVEEILEQLSRPQRICLHLFFGDGLKYREISDRTGYTMKEVKSHVQNGRQRFERLWRKPAGGQGDG